MTRNTMEQAARRDLAAAHRLAVMHGLNEGTWNHLSLESPDDPDQILITPGYTHWSQVTASSLALVGAGGEQLAGERPPIRAGYVIHHPVHKARPDAKCVVHVHAPYSTALSMRRDLRLDTRSSQQAAQFHGEVAYLEVYDDLLQDEAEGARMAAALGDKRVLFLRNHGVLVADATVARAYLALYQLERACMYQLLATASGGELQRIPESVATGINELARNGDAERHFEGMKRLLDEKEPDYAQ